MKNVDLNTASREDLMEIEGVDFVLADNIIGFREEHGGIGSADELRDLIGIDEPTLERIRMAAGEAGQSGRGEAETTWSYEEEEEEW